MPKQDKPPTPTNLKAAIEVFMQQNALLGGCQLPMSTNTYQLEPADGDGCQLTPLRSRNAHSLQDAANCYKELSRIAKDLGFKKVSLVLHWSSGGHLVAAAGRRSATKNNYSRKSFKSLSECEQWIKSTEAAPLRTARIRWSCTIHRT